MITLASIVLIENIASIRQRKKLRNAKQLPTPMPAPTEYTHPINVRSGQLDMQQRGSRNEDFDDKIRYAQLELERIQHEQVELERKKRELEELTLRKHEFLSQQVELTEKLSSAIVLIERELTEMREEMGHLEQCRSVFADHLDKIQKHDPEKWTRENLSDKLDKATLVTDQAADEYDQAAKYFEGSRAGAVFGKASRSSSRRSNKNKLESEFGAQFVNGLAFNLPIIALGFVALVIYFIK